MPISIATKFGEDRVRIAQARLDKVNFDEFHQLRNHNSDVSLIVWLFIELDRDFASKQYDQIM